ncbi:MAG: A24 family peptidase [Clostridia bacterium]|jgi:prepilin peptidase CpaA
MKYILLLSILTICTITDIKERKIHNEVLLLGLIMALLLNAHEAGPSGIIDTIKGLAVGTSVFFIPYLLGWLGAGDAKLTGIIGAFGGWQFALCAVSCTAVAGGIISIILLIRDKRTGCLLQNLKMLFFTRSAYYLRDNDGQYTFPYAIAISLGTGLALGIRVMGYV